MKNSPLALSQASCRFGFVYHKAKICHAKSRISLEFFLNQAKFSFSGGCSRFLVFSALDDDFISVYVASKSLFKRAFVGFVEKLLVCKFYYKLIDKAF